MGDETVANILDGLGNGVCKDDFGGEGAVFCDHFDRINDGDGIEKGLDKHFPDGGDVAVFDVDRAK